MRMIFAATSLLALLSTPALAQVEGFTGVTEVAQGAPYLVTYQGSLLGNESFGFTLRGDDTLIEDHHGNTSYRPDENPVPLFAPDTPGEYDMVLEVDYQIAWRLPVTVTPASVFISAPAAARPGDWVDVTWSGPGGFDDYVRVARPGDPDDVEIMSSIVGDDSPTGVKLPAEEGEYELRYAMGDDPRDAVLARTTIVIGEEAAYQHALSEAGGMVEIVVPAQVQAGGPVEVGFGQLSSRWQVQFVRPGEDRFLDGQGGTFAHLVANPMPIDAPAEPGEYEVLALDPDGLVRARVPVTVVPATATVAIVDDRAGSNYVDVEWTGPAGDHDRVGFAPAGAPADAMVSLSVAYIAALDGSIIVQRPTEPGNYELRYVQVVGGREVVLAAIPYAVR